jgi:hypothetical protein
MSVPRKHHYVPQFYLGGFCLPDGPKGRLFVLDKENGKTFPAKLEDVACERDFYRIEAGPDRDPMEVEHFFSKIESGAADAVRYVIEHHDVPKDELRARLMEFLAVMCVRVPAMLDMSEEPAVASMKMMLEFATKSEENFKATLARHAPEGTDLRYEDAKRLVEGGGLRLSMSQNYRINSLLKLLRPVLPILAQRNWYVSEAAEGAPDFLCSDRPLTLSWTKPMPGIFGPGLGLRNTTAIFPISRRLVLLGLFEEDPPRGILDELRVATLNTLTAIHAKRFVYSGGVELRVALSDGRVLNRAEFVQLLRDHPPFA